MVSAGDGGENAKTCCVLIHAASTCVLARTSEKTGLNPTGIIRAVILPMLTI